MISSSCINFCTFSEERQGIIIITIIEEVMRNKTK